MKSVDTGSSGVSGSLILNSRDLVNDDNTSNLMRTGVSSSSFAGHVIVEVGSGENGTGGLMIMNIDVLSDSDWELLSWIVGLSSFSSGGTLSTVGGESLASNWEDATISAGSTVSGIEVHWVRLLVQEVLQEDLCCWLVVEEDCINKEIVLFNQVLVVP